MHIPVLLKETIEGLNLKEGGTYVDATVNRGGHSKEIAKKIGKSGTLICIDLDQSALDEAKTNLEKIKNHPTFYFVNSNFRHLTSILKSLNIKEVDGIIADLGLSSQELDISGRGFSFKGEEPLLMTFLDKPDEDTLTAKDIVNTWSEENIANILYGFADEKYSRRIAHAIIKRRSLNEIKTTKDLVSCIEKAFPSSYKFGKVHFATKTFQALRMAVNDELNSIKDLILSANNYLKIGGRICLITFHSTEDRIVKQELRKYEDSFKIIKKKAIITSDEEIKENPRSRSAQLRIAEKYESIKI